MTIAGVRNEYRVIPNDFSTAQENEADMARHTPLEEEPPGPVVAAFFFLGMGILLPWNALLSVIDFYSMVFPNISIAQYITNAYSFPFMVTGILLALSTGLLRYRRTAIFVGYGTLTILPALLPIFSTRETPVGTAEEALASKELWLIVFTAAVIGASCAMLQSILFGTLTLFPGGKCVSAFSTGSGVASVFVSVLRILLRILMDGDSKGSPKALKPGFVVFFLTCSVLCCFCIGVFRWLDKYSSYYATYVPSNCDTEGEDEETGIEILRRAWEVMHHIAKPAVGVFLSFAITLSLFPGIVVQVPSSLRGVVSATHKSWYPLVVVTLFAVGDTIGRGFPTERMVIRYAKALPIFSVVRVALVPVYWMQWVGVLPVNWILVMSMVVALGIANGIVATWAFLSIPSLTPLDSREMAGRLMFVMLISGISIGNILGWIVEAGLHSTANF